MNNWAYLAHCRGVWATARQMKKEGYTVQQTAQILSSKCSVVPFPALPQQACTPAAPPIHPDDFVPRTEHQELVNAHYQLLREVQDLRRKFQEYTPCAS